MIERFLKAKHWQLFLITFGIPMIAQIILMTSMFVTVAINEEPDPMFMMGWVSFFPMIMLLFIGGFFGWFWSVAIGLQSKLPEEVSMKVSRFKLFFFIPLVYILLIISLVATAFNGAFESGAMEDTSSVFGMMAIMVPLHFFSMFCILHSLYFVAKTFKTVELQRETTFSDFAGEFFMIWFFPIGIWIVQPKINNMISS